MLKMGSILVVAAGVVLVVSGGTAWGAAITGVTASASGSANAPSDPSGNVYRVTDGSGFNEATGTVTAGGWGAQWVSNNLGSSFPADCWFKLDLASSYNLGLLKVWNGTDAYLNTYTQRRIFQGDIYVSNQASPGAIPTGNASGNGWTLAFANQTFHEATGVVSESNISYSTPDIFDLGGNTGRWVGIHIDQVGSNWQGWGYYAGIAEIRVFEGQPTGDIPEPATMALLGLAAAGLGGYVRRRRTA